MQTVSGYRFLLDMKNAKFLHKTISDNEVFISQQPPVQTQRNSATTDIF